MGEPRTVAETTFSDVRCSLCGASRLQKNGKPEVCSLIGCKDPSFDVDVERAREALVRLYEKAIRGPNAGGVDADYGTIAKMIGIGGPRRRQ